MSKQLRVDLVGIENNLLNEYPGENLMEVTQLLTRARSIATEIGGSEDQERYALHQQLHRTLELIKLNGGKVPGALRRLDLDLIDEEIERSFDNMPV